MKNLKTLLVTGAVILSIIGFVWWGIWDRQQKVVLGGISVSPDAIVLYYGKECPHCKDVDKYIEKHNVANKVEFEKKEVWHDARNATEMTEHAKICGLSSQEIGVPFLFVKEQCYIGTPDVIEFFEGAAK